MCQTREDGGDSRSGGARRVRSYSARSLIPLICGLTFISATPFDKRVTELSVEYQAVEREIFRLEDRAGELGRELAKAQIAQVSYRINDLEEKIRLTGRNPILFRQIVQGRVPTLFERDRATLNRVLQNEPELAPEAQSVLDRLVILTMYISDQPRPCALKKVPPDLPQNPTNPCIVPRKTLDQAN